MILKGCSNLNEEMVTKYLNPSPVMAKGHMEQPKKGLRSTQPKKSEKGASPSNAPAPVPQIAPPDLPIFAEPSPYQGPAYGARTDINLIQDNKSSASMFCFGAFAEKVCKVVVVSRLDMYRTKVLMYRTMVLMACLTKVRC
jgi:hypothetical protein